jgi:hypothetical protein
MYMSVGVMKDEKLKMRDLQVSDTLFHGGLEHPKIKPRLIQVKSICLL